MKNRGLFGISWLDFEPKARKEKREKVYMKRMYPFGKEQEDWEEKMVRELFPNKKKNELILARFITMTRREIYVSASLDEESDDYQTIEEGFYDWHHTETKRFVKPDELRILMAMGDLEQDAQSMEEMPTAQQIIEKAATYTEEDMNPQ